MHTQKSNTSKNNFDPKIIFLFSQKIKRKHKYEKEGQDIHISRITTTFDLIRQPAAIAQTKIKVFIKNSY